MKAFFLLLPLLVLTSAANSTDENKMIGTVATKDHLIEIWSGNQSPLYRVKDIKGTVLAEKMSAEQLAKHYPELSKLIERGVADDASLGPELSKPPGAISRD